ncbi:hypothetical protein [Alloalcanivorax gelatiniphagus]|uniref:DUF3325 domain-containing protein n=1 Tax=Alloalcanivorax gelatiniphagus TaxID=1194167 RepID=A0ABY2XHV1_9GAMM|nr:hypothetical protein [Alloalcanivorax gelatiniphagus]TMW11336.1 hypothetical protein FGS76_14860 [Alloalcanivorax gelatiniphagus]|tara:strand:- start:7418 stop:7708 length:291 start_codon:yes stop_codon:yes gene_type:complete
MPLLLLAVQLGGCFLLYLSDRQQRALYRPLPPAARLAGGVLVAGAAAGWAWQLGIGVGLFTALWVFALGAMAPALMVGHWVDGYRPGRRQGAGERP